MQHDNSPSPTPSPLPSPTASLKPSPEANFLFVYGTLRLDVRSALQERGIANHALEAFHSNLHSKAQFVASAQVLGRLYLVTDNSADAPAHYPALILATKHPYPAIGLCQLAHLLRQRQTIGNCCPARSMKPCVRPSPLAVRLRLKMNCGLMRM